MTLSFCFFPVAFRPNVGAKLGEVLISNNLQALKQKENAEWC